MPDGPMGAVPTLRPPRARPVSQPGPRAFWRATQDADFCAEGVGALTPQRHRAADGVGRHSNSGFAMLAAKGKVGALFSEARPISLEPSSSTRAGGVIVTRTTTLRCRAVGQRSPRPGSRALRADFRRPRNHASSETSSNHICARAVVLCIVVCTGRLVATKRAIKAQSPMPDHEAEPERDHDQRPAHP